MKFAVLIRLLLVGVCELKSFRNYGGENSRLGWLVDVFVMVLIGALNCK